MFGEQHLAEVREYFGVFNPPPPITLDEGQNTDNECCILIDGGLSIGRHFIDAKSVLNRRYTFKVYNYVGEDDGNEYTHLTAAIKAAMGHYAAELFNRVNDRITTAAQAEEFA